MLTCGSSLICVTWLKPDCDSINTCAQVPDCASDLVGRASPGSDLDGRASPASNLVGRASLVGSLNGRASPNNDLDGRASSASNLVGRASPDTDLDGRGKQLLATQFPDGTLNWRGLSVTAGRIKEHLS